jgi:hypothetical protein
MQLKSKRECDTKFPERIFYIAKAGALDHIWPVNLFFD